MSRFLNRVLPLLETIYKFPGGVRTAVRQINLASPIQLVHDVSRQAERGTGVGEEDGWFIAELTVAAGSASNFYGSLDLYDLLGASGFQLPNAERDYRIWIMNLAAYIDAGDADLVTKWSVNVSQEAGKVRLSSSGQDPVWMLAGGFGQPALAYPISKSYSTDGWDMMPLTTVDGEGGVHTTRLPLYVPPPAKLSAGLQVTAAVTAPGLLVQAMCWAGKKGTTPPGLG